ncbi:MAG: hypothetical protein HQK83_09395 [Fibrobacteria bacterium]|nr:hypothetical protein [Fibrobacteria bacterium]
MAFLLFLCLLSGCAKNRLKYAKNVEETLSGFSESVQVKNTGEEIYHTDKISKSNMLYVLVETPFGKEKGESSIRFCALTVFPSSLPEKKNKDVSSADTRCYGPATLITTRSDGMTNWSCYGSAVSCPVCWEKEKNFYVADAQMKRYLKHSVTNLFLDTLLPVGKQGYTRRVSYEGVSGKEIHFAVVITDNRTGNEFSSAKITLEFKSGMPVNLLGHMIKISEADEERIVFRVHKHSVNQTTCKLQIRVEKEK